MSLSATTILTSTHAGHSSLTYPVGVKDNITGSAGCSADAWAMAVVVGGRTTKVSDGTPWDTTLAASFVAVVHPSFSFASVHDPQPSGAFTNGVVDFDDCLVTGNASIPKIAVTWPGALSLPITTGDTFGYQLLPSGSGGTPTCDIAPYMTALFAISGAFFDGTFFPIWNDSAYLNGSTHQASGANATSGTLTSTGSQFSASGHGAVSIAVFAWDDPALTPTISAGWTTLGTYKDAMTGWCAILVGKITAPGDVASHTVTATWSSAANISGLVDVWQQDILPTGPSLIGEYRSA